VVFAPAPHAGHVAYARPSWGHVEMDLIALLLVLGLAVTAFAWLAFADRV
jgi:hypothetical protein